MALPLILCFSLLFLLTACGPKQRVVIDRSMPPPVSTDIQKEARIPFETKIETRETREVQYGVASWYGGEFHGRPTSSGEVYDMFQLTCAHNSLPLGTVVLVTNLENGRSVELKVNDRGPFVKSRIIDVSYAAARMLGMWEKGTAKVKVEWVGAPLIEQVERFHLQVGSFSDETKAQDLAERLKRSFDNVFVATVETQTQKYHRVRIGPFESKEAALPLAAKMTEMGFHVLVTNR